METDSGTPEPGDASSAIRVVVVDDHSMVADALAAVVDSQPDMEVVGTAGDVDEALALVDRVRPDLVLMDYNLPSGDGVTCAATMKARDPHLRLLILTGQETGDVVTRAITIGADGFLRKTTSVSDMVGAIRRANGGDPVFLPSDLAEAVRRVRTGRAPSDLSERELEVLQCMANGLSTVEIGEALFISLHTVRSHVRHILEKLQAHSKLEAVSVALREGIVTLDR